MVLMCHMSGLALLALFLGVVDAKSNWQENARQEQQQRSPDRPNILLLLTDDQDVVLGSFDHMPHVRSLIQEEGMTFSNGFVHTPICCPSRSSIMTGRYLHNNGVRNNSISGNCYGSQWKEEMEPHHTFAVHLQSTGYATAYTGKYLNQYGYQKSKEVPAGWDHWLGLAGNSRYYNYTLVEGSHGRNGNSSSRVIKHGDTYPDDYLPSVMNQRVLRWMAELPQPWLIVAAWPTPHGPFTPAPWAVGTMSDHHPPTDTPNYNASDQSMHQKHWLLRQLHPISNHTAAEVDVYYQRRLEALKSIDNHVGELVEALNRTDQVDRTVILYTSDNGFQFGQHRLSMDKRHLYEHDIRVPFCLRGPGIPPNSKSTQIVANIDIAPTLLDMAQVPNREAMSSMDGLSFWEYVRGKTEDAGGDSFTSRRDLLISYNGEGQHPCGLAECPMPWDGVLWMPDSTNNTYHCVRTIVPTTVSIDKADDGVAAENSIYCRFLDDEKFVEYYDLRHNPYQLNNDLYILDPVQRQRYEQRLQELLDCQGSSSCRA